MSASASPSALLCSPPVSIVTYTPIALTRKFSALTPSLTSKVEEVMHSQDWVLNQESKLDMGYVSTDSDLLSPMFTPLVKLEVDHESPAFQHAFSTLEEIGLKLQGLNLRLYQTGIATLQATLAPSSQEQLTLCWQKIENRDIEQSLSLILQAAGGVMINLLNTTFDTLSKPLNSPTVTRYCGPDVVILLAFQNLPKKPHRCSQLFMNVRLATTRTMRLSFVREIAYF
jgi:hypothetical protein